MRRYLIASAALLLGAASITACDQAKELVTNAGCAGIDAALKAIPAPDSLSESTIKGLSSAAGVVQKALKAIPTDKVPDSVQGKVDSAIADIEDATSKFASDPASAKAAAGKAITSLTSALTDTKGNLGC
jgi:hypothetical protein